MTIHFEVEHNGHCFVKDTEHKIGVPLAINEDNIPCISLEYDSESYGQVAPLLHVMQSRCVKPVLHIWNLEQQFPHVALVFELSRPSLDTLKAAIDAESAETVYWSGCKKILVCAEGAVPLQDNVRTLVSAFKIQGIGLALVTEKGAGEIQKTYPRISMPVQKLLTRPPSYH